MEGSLEGSRGDRSVVYDDTATGRYTTIGDSTPDVAWTFDYAVGFRAGNLDRPSITAIGPDMALVIPELTSRQPVHVDYTPIATLVDLRTGEALWSTDLSDVVYAGGERVEFEVDDVPGAAFLTVGTYAWAPEASNSFALDKATGEVVDVLGFGARIYADGGGVIVESHDDERGVVVVRRFDSAQISGTPTWEVVTPGEETVVEDGVVVAHGRRPPSTSSDQVAVDRPFMMDLAAFDAATGEEFEWSSQLDELTSFALVGDRLVRIRATDASFTAVEVMGVDERGTEVWDAPVMAQQVDYADGALYVAYSDRDPSRYGDLMRINPDNGEEMWDEPFSETISLEGRGSGDGLGMVGGQLVLGESGGSEFWSVDATTGEETARYGGDAYVRLGETVFYAQTSENLTAYVPGNSRPVWKIEIDPGDEVWAVGAHLFVFDEWDHTMKGLA